MVKNRSFLDTNVLVYQFDRSAPRKQEQSRALIERLIVEERAVISSQVIQEFMNVALKKFSTQLSPKDIEAVMTDFLKPFCQHFPVFDFYKRALGLYASHSLSLYDALIVQAAIDLHCTILYSEDLQEGQRFGGLVVVNPFKE